jgi:hypothetical protein
MDALVSFGPGCVTRPGSKTEVSRLSRHVRFTLKNRSVRARAARPFHPQRTNPLSREGLAARSGDYVCRSNALKERR